MLTAIVVLKFAWAFPGAEESIVDVYYLYLLNDITNGPWGNSRKSDRCMEINETTHKLTSRTKSYLFIL